MKHSQRGFISLILIVTVAVLVIGTGIYLLTKPKTSTELNNFQQILDNYSICVNTKDVNCQCKYLIESHCGRGSEAEYAVNSKLLKDKGIITLGTDGNNISGLDPSIYTRAVNYSFIASSGTYSGSCLSVSFVEERGIWKLFDVDGPVPADYCK